MAAPQDVSDEPVNMLHLCLPRALLGQRGDVVQGGALIRAVFYHPNK